MNGRSNPINTEYLKKRNSIRKRESSEMKLNTELYQQSRCCLSLHKLYVDLV